MRLLAIVLIVNSHFNVKYITNFEQIGVYGYLGNLGNLIFFFISSYVLTLGFYKYKKQVLRWVIYRQLYLVTVVVVLRFILESILSLRLQNPILMIFDLYDDIDFISVMLYMSAVFPFLYGISKKARFFLIFILVLVSIGFGQYLDIKVVMLISYILIFTLGIMVSKEEMQLRFSNNLYNFLILAFFAMIFTISKAAFDFHQVNNICKIMMVVYLFYFLEDVRVLYSSTKINNLIGYLASLSLYIYISHFYFINFSFQINKYAALPILFILVVPICHITKKIFNEVLLRMRKLIMPLDVK